MQTAQSPQIERSNESLEKSLQALRGKLSGIRDENTRRRVHPLKNIDENKQSNPRNVDDKGIYARVGQPGIRAESAKLNPKRHGQERPSFPKVSELKSYPKSNRVAFQLGTESEKNLFDEFRSRVNEIRNSRLESIEPFDSHLENAKFSNQSREDEHGTSTRTSDIRRHGEARQFLTSKIEQQNEHIEALRAEVLNLRVKNVAFDEENSHLRSRLATMEKDHERQEILHREAISRVERSNYIDSKAVGYRPFESSSFDDDKLSKEQSLRFKIETELTECRKENSELRRRVSEIAERAQFLSSIQEQRIKTLEEKLKASMGVAKYYCDNSNEQWQSATDDLTDEILFGAQDQTTIDLLKDMPEYQQSRKTSGRKTLRSYFLAVLFMVRLKNETQAQRLWDPYMSP